MFSNIAFRRRAALCSSISLVALLLGHGLAVAQTASDDIGAVNVKSTGVGGGLPPLSSPKAVGSNAPAGSAPALAPTQSSLEAFQPISIVSDKVLRDVIPNSADYNEAVKFTPGWVSSNTNGLLGDTKGGWRGYQDGQYNITFDGVPFGDANDPTHHSAAYFPSAFLGQITVDRGPGAASQIGYATFGGTLGLHSIDLSDTLGGNIQTGFGTFATQNTSLTMQTGEIAGSGVRGLFQYNNSYTAGAIDFGKYNLNQFLGKIEKRFDNNIVVTVFATYGTENYNNVNPITYPQWQLYGKRYGQVNGNRLTQQFVGYNNSQKQTDMEYVDVKGEIGSWRFDNKGYTYSYWYPALQNNGLNQGIEGAASLANGGTINSVSIPTITGGKIKVTINGVSNGNVIGYYKYNNYRAYGDIFKAERDIDAGVASGTARFGMWFERVDNSRLQQYVDYTTGQTFSSLGNPLQASYKLDLNSHITNYQPFAEYDWHPLEGLTITPGVKWESFTRDHNALVNQTTLQNINFSKTYDTTLPFLAANYKVTPEVSIYGQASKGVLAPTVSAFYVFDPQLSRIKPQTTDNYQAGVVYKTGRITADADVYQVTATNFPITTNLPTGEQIYVNGGTARYRGFEAEASYNIFNGFSVFGSGALMDSKFSAGQFNGLRLPDAPKNTYAVGLIYDDGMLFGSLAHKFTGEFYGSSGQKLASNTTNAELNHVKSYDTTDLVVGIRSSALHDLGIGKSVQVKLGIYNLLNHRNVTEISGDPTGTTNINNTTMAYSFLPGRLVFGSVNIGF